MINAELFSHLGKTEINKPLANMTTYRIGGNADLVLYPYDSLALIEFLNIASANNIDYRIIGKGSDLLCSDDPYNGVIIRLDMTMNNIYFNDQSLLAEAGCSLVYLASQCMKKGLSGLEFASGIPGTIGGAIFMNAGAYKSNMADIVEGVLVLKDNECVWLTNEECRFSYRSSIFQKHRDWIILAAKLVLKKEDPSIIEDLMRNRKERRMANQPLDYPSCGSVFRNPDDKPAWQYIADLGYRGKQVGGARVSEKHCNFIINTGNAKARDVIDLINMINDDMEKTYGFRLETEVEKFNWTEK